MSNNNSRGSFWTLGLSGLIGVVIGAGGMYFSQKQANTAENQYFMELDQLRHSTFLNEDVSFEDKLENLRILDNVRSRGFRHVFEKNLQRDISEIQDSIERIAEAKRKSEEAATAARLAEEQRAKDMAEIRKQQAVRTNPLIFENCGFGSNTLCP